MWHEINLECQYGTSVDCSLYFLLHPTLQLQDQEEKLEKRIEVRIRVNEESVDIKYVWLQLIGCSIKRACEFSIVGWAIKASDRDGRAENVRLVSRYMWINRIELFVYK